jgi:hypothetical protein
LPEDEDRGIFMNFKKTVLLVFAINIIFAQTVVGASLPLDIIGESYEASVAALFDKGIITGDEKGNYNPEQTLTRAQACIIVVKSMTPPISEVAGTATQDAMKSGFPDMSGYSWAEGYISYAVKKGVTKGYPNGTFKPGNKVSSNELITMILRGAGYSDASLEGVWPDNYINMADTLNLYNNLPVKDAMPQFATKWMAAQMDYNALKLIESANILEKKIIYGVPESIPDFKQAKFILTGSFDINISHFDGYLLADNIKLYTLGKRSDYQPGMTLSAIKSDYITGNIYKYKRVITPAQYILENDKITRLLLPNDVGYTGNIYCVINDNSDGFNTLTAAREINWSIASGLKNIYSTKNYSDGAVFKLEAFNGKIQSIKAVTDMLSGFSLIEDYKINGPVLISSGGVSQWGNINSNATVYTVDVNDPKKYNIGSTASIKIGSQIKLFDISDDDEIKADIVIIKE